jgi:excisionase family DNA binding protein
MRLTFIQQVLPDIRQILPPRDRVLGSLRFTWGGLGHLRVMDTEYLSGLGLEPVLTTSELADYLGVQVQAIYDLRTDGRGPSGIRVGREIRYRVSDVRHWLDDLQEPQPSVGIRGRRT